MSLICGSFDLLASGWEAIYRFYYEWEFDWEGDFAIHSNIEQNLRLCPESKAQETRRSIQKPPGLEIARIDRPKSQNELRPHL